MKKIKVCGLTRLDDIEAVNGVKPEYCGFILNFPKSRRNISIETAEILRKELIGEITPVGVFVDCPVQTVADLLNSDVIDVAQLHGSEDNEYILSLRKLTNKPIWQAFQIRSAADIGRAKASPADFVILDAGQGTGNTFNWSLIRGFSRPFGLAGGLNAGNLPDALETDAVLLDVSGGVETDGLKDSKKIMKFAAIVRNSDKGGAI